MFWDKKRPSGLMARICSYWRSHVSEDEYLYYKARLKESNGKALELACGGGRLLLRYLFEGFDVEGVDSSVFLLDVLRRKAYNAKITPTLYHRALSDIDLSEGKYKLIYIPLGSFHLISDREIAFLSLEKYFKLLQPGGKLIISLFLPWSKDHIDTKGWQIIRDVRLQIKNQRYVERENTMHDPIEELIITKTRFELWDEKDLLQFEERQTNFRWYSKGEFELMLKSVGFEDVSVFRSYREGPPYIDGFMLFESKKH
jgi:SAM-dependent methyltransferase